MKEDNSFEKKKLGWAKDAVTTGETYALVRFEGDAGYFLGYDVEMDPFTGMPIPETQTPRFAGRIGVDKLYGFNVHIDREADSFAEAKFATVDKLHWRDKTPERYKPEPDQLDMINGSVDIHYKVFNGLDGSYQIEKNHVMIHETYIRPCPMYPTGYYFFWTDTGVLEQGELLTFPLFQYNWQDADTSARGFGAIRDLKQTQLEINRIATLAVKESVTLGYSLLLTQLGTKLSQESFGNGMRTVYYAGMKPEIVAGKNGEQYLTKIQEETKDLYTIANVKMHEEEEEGSGDIMALLTRSMKQKAKFKENGIRFQKFLRDVSACMLEYARAYLSEESIVPMIGKSDVVNMAEFKNTDPLCYQIKIIDSNSDVDTAIGKSLQATQVLQYSGKQLNDEQLGLVIESMPFLDNDNLSKSFTLNLKVAENIILGLDRGEQPLFDREQPHEYIINKMVSRKLEADYALLGPEIHEAYELRLEAHREVFKEQSDAAQRAKDGFIPSGGFLVPIQLYGAGKEGKAERLKIPSESLYWLVDQLGTQNSSQAQLNGLPLSQQALMAPQQGPQQPQMPLQVSNLAMPPANAPLAMPQGTTPQQIPFR
jgi:hypothetical protein